MTDVLLTHSYFLRFDPKEYRSMMPYPPLGTLIAASVLRNAGFSVAFHDVLLSNAEEELEQAIVRHGPKILVIYDDQFNYLTKMCLSRMRDAAVRMSAIAKSHGCKVVVFSSDASDHADHYLSHGADVVLCGEAEETVVDVVSLLTGRTSDVLDQVDGVAFLDRGTVIRTPRRKVVDDLDRLPMPAWDLIDANEYRSRWNARHGRYSVNLVTTRGCPFHCNWCAKPIYGQVYHSHSPRRVVEEMEFIQRMVRPDHVWFADDIFGLRPGWIGEFAAEARRRNVRIPFKCLSRADLLLKDDTVSHLRDAGCETVWIGAESGSQRILDAMEKGTTIRQIEEAAKALRAAGIRVGFFLQFGYGGESLAEIDMTLALVHRCMPDEIGISVSYPLPGTRYYDRVQAQMGEKRNWTVSADLDPIVPGGSSPEFYRALHRLVHKRHQIWKGLALLGRWAAHPQEVSISGVRSIAKLGYHSLTLPAAVWRLRQTRERGT